MKLYASLALSINSCNMDNSMHELAHTVRGNGKTEELVENISDFSCNFHIFNNTQYTFVNILEFNHSNNNTWTIVPANTIQPWTTDTFCRSSNMRNTSGSDCSCAYVTTVSTNIYIVIRFAMSCPIFSIHNSATCDICYCPEYYAPVKLKCDVSEFNNTGHPCNAKFTLSTI